MSGSDILKKSGLVIFGTVAALLFVEIALRTSGGLISMAREIRNRRVISQEGAYRILCLGESTTEGQYTPILEELLNKSNLGIAFEVIDEGRGGTSTAVILSILERSLKEYDPHMVVIMMGINDGEWVWTNPVEYENKLSVKLILWLKGMRLNKLATYIRDGLRNRGRIERSPGEIRKASTPNDETVPNRQPYVYGKYEPDEYENLKSYFENAISTAPKNPHRYVNLGDLYLIRGREDEAESLYKKAIDADPDEPHGYSALGTLYCRQGRYVEAEKTYKSGIRADGMTQWLYNDLADLYRQTGERRKEEAVLRSSIAADPKSPWAYYKLASLYAADKNHAALEQLYKDAIQADRLNTWMYHELGKFYIEVGKEDKAAEILAQGKAAAAGLDRAGAPLDLLPGKRELGGLERRPGQYPKIETIRNYRKLRDAVLNHGAKLVCMQYPMRDIEPLRQILGRVKNIIYVENRDNFRAAVRSRPATDIFVDMFGGDFGHCTMAGNTLIAQNLAKTILEEVSSETRDAEAGE